MSVQAHAILIGIGIPILILFLGALLLVSRQRTLPSILQFLGASGLLLVVLTHIAETFEVLPWMHWGSEHSPGHYLDLAGAVFGLTLFPIGYLFQALARSGRTQ